MLDRTIARDGADAVDHVPTQPAGLLLGMGRHEDGIHRRLQLCKRVAHGRDGVALDDETERRDAGVAEQRDGAVEPASGRRASRVLVDDVAPLRLVHRRDHRHA
jgi:hypothetical protein